MSVPVIFYMFLNSFAPVVVHDNFLTTLVFSEPVIRVHTGASASEIYIEKSPDSKMLFIKSKGKALDTNLNVPTRSGKLYSFLIKVGKKPHSIVHVKDGKSEGAFKDIKNLRGVIIQEGSYITKVINNRKEIVTANSIEIYPKGSFEFPKGAPIFLNQERVHR